MTITRSIIAAGALALTTGTALVFAAPAFADPTGPIALSSATLVDPTAPVTDPANAVVGPELSEDQVDAQLRSLAGTQSQAEIDRILASGLRSAMMTDSDTAEVVAAVVLPVDLRTLTPVTPG